MQLCTAVYSWLASSQWDGLLLINVPQNCLSGLYDAQLQLKQQYGLESTPESFEFKVNLSSALIYQKLDNVIAVYNTNGQFTAFQWYRDGELIIGANQEYYVEPGGLIGSYHVQVTTMSGTTAYICPTHNYGYGTNPGTYITIAPNPTTDMITVLLDDYPIGTYLHIYDMKGAVMISQLIDSPFITVSLGHLIQGVYMVGVYDPVRKIKYYEKVIKIER